MNRFFVLQVLLWFPSILLPVHLWAHNCASPGQFIGHGADPFIPYVAHPSYVEAPYSVIESAQNGVWESASTWVGGATPNANHVVIVRHQVTLNSRQKVADTVVASTGKLIFNPAVDTRLDLRTLEVVCGALEIGTSATPIQDGRTAEIVFRDIPVNTAKDPAQYTQGLVVMDGTITIHGHSKNTTFERLAVEPRAGDSVLSVTNALSGWRSGDRIIVPGTEPLPPVSTNLPMPLQWEERVISAGYSGGALIPLSAPLSFDHLGSRDDDGRVDFLPHVGNLSRNVILRSENPAMNAMNVPNSTRGHAMFMHRSVVDIRYALFKDMGRTTNETLDSTTFDGGGTAIRVGTNQIGRYPIHAHHLVGPTIPMANGHQFSLVGNAVDGGSANHDFKWGITVHNSHYGLIQNNVVYNMEGAGILTEDGSESFNVFEKNFVVRSHGTGGRVDGRPAAQGDGFWFRGTNNHVRDNVAANFYGQFVDGSHGYVYAGQSIGDVRYPKFQGADTSVDSQVTIKDGSSVAIREFARNEVYGAESGMTYWRVGYSYKPLATAESLIKDFKIWNVYSRGIFHYPSYWVTIDGLVIRGKRGVSRGQGWEGGDYAAPRQRIINSDIQGFAVGLSMSSMGDGGTQIVENCYLRNNINIYLLELFHSSAFADANTPLTVVIRNVDFATPSGRTPENFRVSTNRSEDETKPWKVFVDAYDRIPGDNFQIFADRQHPSSDMLPTTRLPLYPTRFSHIGLPENETAPMSNLQAWQKYGIATGGQLMPSNAVARAGITNAKVAPFTQNNQAPTIVSGPSANPNPVVGSTADLTVLGADDEGEASLTYWWSAVGASPASVSFSVNGSNAAKNTRATFTEAGVYTIQIIVYDAYFRMATVNLNVTVNQTPTSVFVSPSVTSIKVNGTKQFTAMVRDQFEDSITNPVSFAWSSNGGGAIDNNGLFTAGGTAGGPFRVSARVDSLEGRSSVKITVSDPPTATLTNPSAGASFQAPASISIQADAADTDGNVTKVEFFDRSTKLGEDASSPYRFEWKGVPAGKYSLIAQATDTSGDISQSVPVSVTVTAAPLSNNPPLIALKAPHSGTNYIAPASITLSADAADTDGVIERVEFYSGSTLLKTLVSPPYTDVWSNVPVGTYSITAKAIDDRGESSTAGPATVVVNLTDSAGARLGSGKRHQLVADPSNGKTVVFNFSGPGHLTVFTAPLGIKVKDVSGSDGLVLDCNDMPAGAYRWLLDLAEGSKQRGNFVVVR